MTPDEFRKFLLSASDMVPLPRHYDPYTGLRRDNCSRVERDMRIAEDEAGHEARERSFAEWMQAHPHATWVVAGHLADIAGRREWRR